MWAGLVVSLVGLLAWPGWEESNRLPTSFPQSQLEVHMAADCPDRGKKTIFFLFFFFYVVHEVTSCSLCRVSELHVLTLFLVLRLHW